MITIKVGQAGFSIMPAGRPRRVSNEEILRVFKEAPEPALKIDDVLPELDLSKSGLYKRLPELEDNGWISSKKTGASGKVYWITDDGRAHLEEAEE